MLDEDRDTVLRTLHGTLRHKYMKNIKKHVELSEDKKKQGRWRTVLNLVLRHLSGKKRQKRLDVNAL